MKPDSRDAAHRSSQFVWFIISLCCLLPIAWIIFQIVLNPRTLAELKFDWFRAALLGRTILFSVGVGLIATILALPAACVLGRSRGFFGAALWFVLPISLLMPSLVLAYGWKQFLLLLNLDFEPAGFCDIMRCIWSLATWLWPVPAMVIGLALRRSDPQVQQQALLDGVLLRVMFRQLAGPIIASACVVSLLAMQEFAVYEPTGISVVATEIRMVFETGAVSSPLNPIMQNLSALDKSLTDQPARAAAAVATGLPMLFVVAMLAVIAILTTRKFSAAENVDADSWPNSLNASRIAKIASWLTVILTLVVPILSLIFSLKRAFDIKFIFDEFAPQIFGTIWIAGITGIIAIVLAMAAIPRAGRLRWICALASFLIGGQILAIALIRLYNRPILSWVYNNEPIMVMAYIGRFAWIVLAAAMVTWSKPWRELRDLASIDGADSMQTSRYVIWPLAWPMIAAAGLFVTILSLSEVPATVLISPQRPQMLVPMLMTWLHMLRYDAMIEASLLIAAIVVILGAAAMILVMIGIRLTSEVKSKKEKGKSLGKATLHFLLFAFTFFLLSGCRDRAKPQAVWCTTGIGPAQVVYPRGIAYSQKDDSFFIVDREARIQHLDRDGNPLAAWQTPEWAHGKPVGLKVGPDGNLYVPDTHYHRLLIYSPAGKLLKECGSRGMGPGQFIYPTDIAFSKNKIFVSEYGDNDRVQVFDQNFKYLYQFGKFGDGPGEFSRPQTMVIDGDNVYITDACNHRLEVFKTDGTFVRTMGKVGSAPGEFRFPYGLDEDSHGRLIVCEFGNNRVQLIDKETGKGLAIWGSAGRDEGQLAYPWGVAVDKHNRVVAVDAGNNRLQVFEF
jgi:ABC-type Fe3+ transport system permease subunit/DNA-binding beta-propeller fold protein YncE